MLEQRGELLTTRMQQDRGLGGIERLAVPGPGEGTPYRRF
jgi:hypothetical protein